MSHDTNSNLLERAYEVLEEISGHPSKYDKLLDKAIQREDLDEVHRLVNIIESDLAIEHFHNYGLL